MAETRALKRILKSYESIKAQVITFTENTRINEVRACLAILSDEWKEFQTLEKTVKGRFDDANLESVDKIESSHFDLRKRLFQWEKLIEENIAQGNTTMEELLLNQSNFIQEISSINRRESEVRLPRVNIPSFSGEYSEFPSFRDLFEASIHNNTHISKVHKLQYLKGLLKGEAYALINHFTVTDANYDEVWDKIKARYDKRKHVVHALLKQFMEQSNVLPNCAKSLRHLSDSSDEVMRGLKVLGDQAEGRDPWLIYILTNKLDVDTKEAWADETAEVDFPTLNQLFKFLNKRSDALESLNAGQIKRSNPSKRVSFLMSQSYTVVCPLCSGEHYLGKCETYMELPSSKRKQLVADKKLCFNCLSSTHQSTVCKSKYSCRICRRRHHLTLHPEITVENQENKSTVCSTEQQESTSCNAMLKVKHLPVGQPQAILPTAIVLVNDKFGKQHKCRILLDSGSQCSFISENCAQKLQIERQRANVNITGLTSGTMVSRGKACIMMRSLYNPSIQIKVNALIISQLPSNLPRYPIDIQDKRLIENMELADINFDTPGPIDFLIGADQFFTILENGKRQFNSIILQKTAFGWIVSGQPKSAPDENALCSYTSLDVQIDVNVDEILQRFWKIEEIPNIDNVSPEEAECEEIYDRTHKRQKDGRYMVKLPFKTKSPKLGNSLKVATHRFLSLERKLNYNSKLKEQYVNQIREYIEMGHMTEISQHDTINDSRSYYLPHHSVIKETSDTTKVRVVFDGSSKSSTGVSLNDKLMVGPTIQPTLWATLMRFRQHRIAITADIEKMYRQVLVFPDDADYQRVLWREHPNEKIRHYKLNRVTFGLACSAYLAIRTLQQLARDIGEETITQHIRNDFYVDDFLSGSCDLEGAVRLKEMMMKVLLQGGFVLRKWQSNVECLSDEGSKEITTKLCSDGGNSAVTVLGLHWHPTSDVLTFRVCPEQNTEITKRKVISEASRVFDPLGFLAPSTIILKILFQRLWLLKLDWDDKLPECYYKMYRKVRDEFKYFENIKIKRFTDHYETMQIHGFADASEVAYCAVIYSRTINKLGEISVNFLTAKTKVAPVKRVSLPRLELCAAHLLTKLMFTVKETIAPNAMCYAWTDSSIVLAWLSTYPARWKTFVANRTSQILDKLSRKHWTYVKSSDNPADHGSRGVSPLKLVDLEQWWHGPSWLKQPETLWPTTHSTTLDETAIQAELSKIKLPIDTFQAVVQDDWLDTLFERTSKLQKIFRVVAYVKRFTINLRTRNPAQRFSGELKSKEIEVAKILCFIWMQATEFREDINHLRTNKIVSSKSNLLSLAPFIDVSGVLRVGGRLANADCDYDSKHPVIVPSNHIFTNRLVWETHFKNLHAGPTLTNNIIRQKYWIVIKGRTKIRSILKNCVICTKYARKTSSQLMGNLPATRIVPSKPFTNCGIDFAGPLYFAAKKGRGGTNPIKGYLCIFVCLSVKAVHIEPVSDLTSDAFLAALRRFTARRGVPKGIYTDNGSNFVGAKRILNDACKLIKNINQNYILSEFLSENGIAWHLIPPASPHFGGLWESAVKSVKTHLLKATGNVNLTFEEMATMLCQIENILNSRPLCTTSTDDDYEVLTPAHFLIGTSTGSVPESHITSADSTLSRWQRIQSRIQIFWNKYRTDYINNLQQRRKWQQPKENIKVGDIVIIKEDDLPVCKWPLGRILETHSGDDDLIRVVTIKTSSSTLQRPIVKICKLPVC